MRSFLGSILGAALVGASVGGPRELTNYTFEAFVSEFGKVYASRGEAVKAF